jgi:hypothetical protein
MDFDDLKYSLDSGNIFADTASFMCRDEKTSPPEAKELGLVERRKW